MKSLIITSTFLLLSIYSMIGQFWPFPNDTDANVSGTDVITASYFSAAVDPSVYPNQDENYTEVTSVSSGLWSDPGTWDCGCVPNLLNSVTIEENHTVSLNSSVVINTLHIRPNAELVMDSEMNLSLEVRYDLAVYGTLNLDGVILKMNGTLPQQFLGNCQVSKLFCEGVNDISNNGNLHIDDELWIGPSQFFTNGFVFMDNSATNTVELGPVIYGNIIGDINFSTEIAAAEAGWISIGAPTSDATIQSFVDDFVTTGFIGADYPNYSFNSVNYYVEESDDFTTDYAGVSNAIDPMVPGLGYYVYAIAGNYQFNNTGAANVGDIDISVNYTDNDAPFQDGLNLISNPYPATINWDSQGGWNKENMSGVCYIWDASTKQFKTYMNGLGINGGSPFIKPTEAFWVVASGPSPSLQATETAKVLFNDEYSEPSQHMKITLANEDWSDQLIITSGENASTSFDANFDAFKFEGIGAVPNITCQSEDGVFLAVNDTPLLEEATDVSMFIDIREARDYTLSFEGVTQYIEHQCITLEDIITEEVYDLRTVTEIQFYSEEVTDQERFIMHVGTPISASATAISCTNESTGSILAAGSGDGPWNYIWLDADMNIVGQADGEISTYTIQDLAAGQYTVEIQNNDFCNSLSMDVEVTEPLEVLEETSYLHHIGCQEDGTGEITMDVTGGLQPYFIEWDNGDLGANIENLESGVYVYTLTDGAGCIHTNSVLIEEAIDVSVSFTSDAQTVILDENNEAVVNFTSQTEGASGFEWSFGDGDESTEENPAHTFTQPGFYTVSLYASNEDCDDYHQVVITVEQYSNVSEVAFQNQFTINIEEDELIISSSVTNNSDKVEIKVHDLLGKIIDQKTASFSQENNIKLKLDSANALYVVSVVNSETGQKYIRKISRF